MASYREVQFELVEGRPVTALFQALVDGAESCARLQSVTLSDAVVSVLIDYEGAPEDVARLRDVLHGPLGPTVLSYDTLVDEPRHLRFVATWRRPAHGLQGVSLEHLLHDAAGPSALLFGRVERGVIAYKAASPCGRGLSEFLEGAQRAFDGRYKVRPLRAGPFRPGWEIEEPRRRVDADDAALLAAALAAGYYDEPKRCGVRELGDVLGVSKSVVARRLRSLERRALEALVP